MLQRAGCAPFLVQRIVIPHRVRRAAIPAAMSLALP